MLYGSECLLWQIAQAQVFIRRMLAVVMNGDGQNDHGHLEQIVKQINWHRTSHHRQNRNGRTSPTAASADHSLGCWRVHVVTQRGVAVAPGQFDDLGWARRVSRSGVSETTVQPFWRRKASTNARSFSGFWSGTRRKSMETCASAGIAFAAFEPTWAERRPRMFNAGRMMLCASPSLFS